MLQPAPVPAKHRPLARQRRLMQIESPENKPRLKLPKNSAQPNKPSAKRMLPPFRTRRKTSELAIAGILACPGKGMAITTDTAERVAEPAMDAGLLICARDRSGTPGLIEADHPNELLCQAVLVEGVVESVTRQR